MNPSNYSLNIGTDPTTDEFYLCLRDDRDGTIHTIAEFVNPGRMDAFILWMRTQGYDSVAIPRPEELDEDLNKFFE